MSKEGKIQNLHVERDEHSQHSSDVDRTVGDNAMITGVIQNPLRVSPEFSAPLPHIVDPG